MFYLLNIRLLYFLKTLILLQYSNNIFRKNEEMTCDFHFSMNNKCWCLIIDPMFLESESTHWTLLLKTFTLNCDCWTASPNFLAKLVIQWSKNECFFIERRNFNTSFWTFNSYNIQIQSCFVRELCNNS